MFKVNKITIWAVLIFTVMVGFGYLYLKMVGSVNDVKQDKVENANSKEEHTQIYWVELPAGLDTIEFKASLTLNPNKQIHKIKFPSGGTETNICIYDSTYLKAIQQDAQVKIKPLRNGTFSKEQEAILDISSLQRGRYYVHYVSCGLGSIFSLTIK